MKSARKTYVTILFDKLLSILVVISLSFSLLSLCYILFLHLACYEPPCFLPDWHERQGHSGEEDITYIMHDAYGFSF